ncbi:protein of unknown function [Hyphomicrobium sp. MC1]|nr:protein of unknown function [Hyphomicrobium sp. MC1]
MSFLIAAGAEVYPDAAHKKRQSMPPLQALRGFVTNATITRAGSPKCRGSGLSGEARRLSSAGAFNLKNGRLYGFVPAVSAGSEAGQGRVGQR